MNLSNHIEKSITAHGLEEAKFLVAVSGGEDSMVLLHAFDQSGFPFRVAHVNYQLRGEDSDLDQKLVEDYCKANSIEFSSKKCTVSSAKGIQEQAREIRYTWFQELLEEFNLDYIVTAHHMNDSVETMLFNLLRGNYQKQAEVTFRLDKSNLNSKYSRNKIRNQLFSFFREINPQYISHINESSKLISEGQSAIKYLTNEIWDSNMKAEGLNSKLKLNTWCDLDFARSILFEISMKVGLSQSESKESIKLLESSSGKAMDFDEFKVWRNRKEIFYQKKTGTTLEEFFLEIPVIGEYDLPSGKINLSTEKNEGDSQVEKHELICKVESLVWPLVIRTWRHGDRFQPFGMKGSQKVSDLLIQNKVPISEKDKVLILESDGVILWVLGLRTSEETRVTRENSYYLKAFISD